jgi:hypothetical protein
MLWNADGVVSRCERLHVVSNKDCLDILAKLEEAVSMWDSHSGRASRLTGLATQGVLGRSVPAARTTTTTTTPASAVRPVCSNGPKSRCCIAMHVVVQALGFLCVLQPFGRDAMGEPAINRLGSAPRSRMGSGEQSAAVEGRGCRMAGIDTTQRPPLPARALIRSV